MVATERTERIEAKSALRENERRFHELADNISQFVWTADETGWIYWYNKRWLDYTGMTLEEMEGWGWQKVHHPDHVERVVHRIRQSFESGTTWEDTFPLRGRDGNYRWFLSRALPIHNEAGKVIRWFGTNTDITEQIELENALRETTHSLRQRSIDLQATRERAELTASATTKFLATVSHDIRQPLQAVALLLRVLRDDVTSPDGKHTFLAIERSLGSAIALLDSLLDFIKFDAGSLQPQMTAIRISDILEDVSDAFSPAAAQKGLIFTVQSTKLAARSDAQLLGRILRNFVSNAIKYTDYGRILIGCRRRGNRVRIEVWDTGCGIPEEHQRQIFWEFVQLEGPERSRSGLGLGLAIVDRLAKLLGHHVEVRSWPGRGSVFSVELVADRTERFASNKTGILLDRTSIFNGKLIAIIDDDEAVREALARLMWTIGATPVTAPQDDELLNALKGRRPDLVIADRNLGGGRDGFEALNRLEKTLGGRLPSVILTGDYDVRDQEQANKSGRCVLHKPVWPAALEAALSFELSRSADV